jgi:L-ascorbate metabolism protein UlaG (beta-lactamase superfamily)
MVLIDTQNLCVDSHACYFVELPTPPGAARGVRIIFDPVFSKRCSPSSWVGPARFTGEALAADARERSHVSPSRAH